MREVNGQDCGSIPNTDEFFATISFEVLGLADITATAISVLATAERTDATFLVDAPRALGAVAGIAASNCAHSLGEISAAFAVALAIT